MHLLRIYAVRSNANAYSNISTEFLPMSSVQSNVIYEDSSKKMPQRTLYLAVAILTGKRGGLPFF
jgi:hypothetical protein